MTELEPWRIINGRSAASALTGEFLFELYQRHNPMINPFRFNEFRVVFADRYAVSSAPEAEWLRLAENFGLALGADEDRLWSLMETLLTREQHAVDELINRLRTMDLVTLSDEMLASLILQCIYTPLGDIYEVNLVQVETALTAAAQRELDRLGRPDLTLARLAMPHPTAMGDFDRVLARAVLTQRASGTPCDLASLEREWRKLASGYGADARHHVRHRLEDLATQPGDRLEALATSRPLRAADTSIRPDGLLKRIVRFADLTARRRDRNKAKLGTVTAHRDALVGEVSNRTGISSEMMSFYLLDEMLGLLRNRARVDPDLLAMRRTNGLVWEVARSLGSSAAPATAPSSTWQGQGASSGTFRGRAVVLSPHFDPACFATGDVLIATGTDFNLALVMRRAGAIVTDEGGILSHASVIAREFGIPCVVGLNGASRSIRTGEIVEVDGTSGLVRRVLDSGEHAPTAVAPPSPAAFDLIGFDAAGRKASNLVALGRHVPTPKVLGALSVELCAALLDGRESIQAVAVAVAQLADDAGVGHVCLRSSSPLEDGDIRSAAGVFESAIQVATDSGAIRDALRDVLKASQQPQVRDYVNLPEGIGPVPIAIVLTEFVDLAHWGTVAIVESGRRARVELHQGNGPTGKNYRSYWLDLDEEGLEGTVTGRLRTALRGVLAFVRTARSDAACLLEVGVKPTGEIVVLQWRPLPNADRRRLEED